MKKLYFFCTFLFLMSMLYSQAPDSFQYQAVIRSADGTVIADQEIGVQIRLLLNASDGTRVYTEEHSTTTNTYGLMNLKVGAGSTTDDFSSIDWSAGTYFIEISLDVSGGQSYQLFGVSQILSVPYALHARKAAEYDETDPVYVASEAAQLVAGDAEKLANLSGTNTGDQDISGIATNTQAIKDTASQIREDIPDVSGFISSETDPAFTAWDKSYADLANTPGIIDSVSVVLDTTTQFIRTEVDGDATNEIQSLTLENDTLKLSSDPPGIDLSQLTIQKDWIYIRYPSYQVGGLHTIPIVSSEGNLSRLGNVITLKAHTCYELHASLFVRSTAYFYYQWHDITNSQPLGNYGGLVGNRMDYSSVGAHYIFCPEEDIEVDLRIIGFSGTNYIDFNGSYGYIKEL